MNNTDKSTRLDKIERQLTPKLWAIKLADEIRRYNSQIEFLKAIGKGTYRQTPFTMPFYELAQQATERWPGGSPDDIRRGEALNNKLRKEFQALKTLINNINTEIQIKTETNRLKAALQLSKLHTLILKDSIAHAGVAEIMAASLGQLQLAGLLEDWADDSANLLIDMTTYKSAVQTIQDDYFEGHPILYKDNELAFEMTIQTVLNAIKAFNEYLKVRTELSNRDSDHEQQKARLANATIFERESRLPIDIQAVEKRAEWLIDITVKKWVRNAKFSATSAILQETGKHEDFVWEHFQKEIEPQS